MNHGILAQHEEPLAPGSGERFNILVVRPAGDPHFQAYAGAAENALLALRKLGRPARMAENQMIYDATNIVFGAHNLDASIAETLPANSIIYNTEIIAGGGPFVNSLEPFARRFEVWDYSAANVEAWRAMGWSPRVRWLRPGYLPESSTIDPATPADIDVLFYGNVNERRRTILDAIAREGLRLHVTSNTYAGERDALIARSSIVLNVHARKASILEFARVSQALSNRRALVSEGYRDDVDEDLRDGIATAPAEELPRLCRTLVEDEAARSALAQRGFELFRRRDYVSTVRHALAQRDAEAHRSA